MKVVLVLIIIIVYIAIMIQLIDVLSHANDTPSLLSLAGIIGLTYGAFVFIKNIVSND